MVHFIFVNLSVSLSNFPLENLRIPFLNNINQGMMLLKQKRRVIKSIPLSTKTYLVKT